MTRLEKLIEQLCPDGVNFKRLGAVAEIRSGWGFPNKEQGKKQGDVPFFKVGDMNVSGNELYMVSSKNYIDNSTVERLKCKPAPEGTIIFPKIGAAISTNKKRILVCKSCYDNNVMGLIAFPCVESRYLYYLIDSVDLMNFADYSGAMPSIRKSTLEKYTIPVPPLEVQQEIVRILDQFTQLTAELTAELTARKKQYHYYRSKLLAQQTNVQKVSLRSVVKHSCSGATPAKSNSDYYGGGTIPWLRTQDVRFNEIYSVDSFITEKAVEETAAKWIPENCVIVAISGATAGRCAINKIKTTTNQHCLNLEIDAEKALYKYVYYCVCNQHEELLSKKQGARGDLNSSLILGMQIPLPPLPEQRRIVAILDRFDALCNDLTIGLPAEIAARQRQYEYYRDKLLTFPQKN